MIFGAADHCLDNNIQVGCLFLVGGNLNNGANCGFSAVNANNGLGNSNWNYGARNFNKFYKDQMPKCITPSNFVKKLSRRNSEDGGAVLGLVDI